jgi:hypothetical protein
MRLKRHAETHALKEAVEKNSAAGQAETHALKEACRDACA